MWVAVSRAGVALGSLGISGCATAGDMGMVMSRVTVTPKALLVDAYGWGLDARPHRETCGITAGYRHSTYIFDRSPSDPPEGVGGWTLFHTPLPERRPLAIAATSGGLNLGCNHLEIGFSLGLTSIFYSSLPAKESAMLHLSYHPGAPEATRAEFSKSSPEKNP